MKKLKPIIVSIILLTIPFILFQCTDQHLECEVCDEDASLEMEALPPVLFDFSIAGVSLPSGTMVEYVTPRIAQLTYPEGYKWVTVNSGGESTMSKKSTYTCSSASEGCNVITLPADDGWDIGCSSSTHECTGSWLDSNMGGNSGFIKIDK